jgi:hypothetical protein
VILQTDQTLTTKKKEKEGEKKMEAVQERQESSTDLKLECPGPSETLNLSKNGKDASELKVISEYGVLSCTMIT